MVRGLASLISMMPVGSDLELRDFLFTNVERFTV